MAWARIDESDCVFEVVEHDPTGLYHPSCRWVEVPSLLTAWITTDWRLVDGVPAPPSLDHLVDQMLAKLAERGEFEALRGVVMPDGYRVDTSERGRTRLLGAYLHAGRLAQDDPDAVIRWKASRRLFEAAPATVVMERGSAAFYHVQHCVDREFTITQAILAAPDVAAAVAAYDAAIDAYGATGATGWPGTPPGNPQG